MDIKLINPNVLAYMDAVKDCNERGKFRASDLNDVKAFLRLFASKPGQMDNFDHRNRTSVFNMLPDALRLDED